MSPVRRLLLLMLIAALATGTGCQKKDPKSLTTVGGTRTLSPSTCKSRLLGIPSIFGSTYSDIPLSVGKVDFQNGSVSGTFGFDRGSCYSNHAVIMDSTYAILLPDNWNGFPSTKTILRISKLDSGTYKDLVLNGTVMALAANATTHTYYAVSYGPGNVDTLISFKLTGKVINSWSQLGTFTHIWVSPPTLAVDEQTNTVYLAIVPNVISGTSVCRYKSGTNIITTLSGANPAGYFLTGLNYSPVNHYLYAVGGASEDYVIRIDPQSGATTLFKMLSQPVNNEFYSTAYDKCSNRLYISAKDSTASPSGYLTILDLGTGYSARYSLPHFYQGLAISDY